MKINHIGIFACDIDAACEFFIKYFNAQKGELYHNTRTGFRSYFLSFDDGTRLEIMNKPDTAPQQRNASAAGLAHVSFSVGSKQAVDALAAQLNADGFEVTDGPRTTGDGYYECAVRGIEGIDD